MYITESIQCEKCKGTYEWEEPEDYNYTDTMPDGSLIGGVWICLDCSVCDDCFDNILERKCDCGHGPLFNKFTGAWLS